MIKLLDLTFQHHEQQSIGRLLAKPLLYEGDWSEAEHYLQTPSDALASLAHALLDEQLREGSYTRSCCEKWKGKKGYDYCPSCGVRMAGSWHPDDFIDFCAQIPEDDVNGMYRVLENGGWDVHVNPEDYLGLKREEVVWVPQDAERFLLSVLDPTKVPEAAQEPLLDAWEGKFRSAPPDRGEFLRNLNNGNIVACGVCWL